MKRSSEAHKGRKPKACGLWNGTCSDVVEIRGLPNNSITDCPRRLFISMFVYRGTRLAKYAPQGRFLRSLRIPLSAKTKNTLLGAFCFGGDKGVA